MGGVSFEWRSLLTLLLYLRFLARPHLNFQESAPQCVGNFPRKLNQVIRVVVHRIFNRWEWARHVAATAPNALSVDCQEMLTANPDGAI
jgi:hypothetical protein